MKRLYVFRVNTALAFPEEKERSVSPTENSSKESKGLLTTGATKVKKKRKSVTWKEDHQLKEIFYFELDEDERGRGFILLGDFTM